MNWGSTHFTYKREDVERIVELLDHNQNSIVSTYEILMTEVATQAKTVEWLRLIESISKIAPRCNFKPSKTWIALTGRFESLQSLKKEAK